jgi:cobalt-zinc-cadmium efflux system membrane fusion protein
VAVKVGDRVEQGQPLATFDNIDAGELATQYDAARSELARLQTQLTAATRQTDRSHRLADIGAVPQREYEAALSEQHQLEASVEGQQATVTGLESRLRRFGVSRDSDPTSVSIRSPFAGFVMQVTAAPGEVVDPSSDLFAIADISRVYIEAQVYEADLGRVHVGQLATVAVDAYSDERFAGRVATVGDRVDPQTRTVAVRCELDNTRRRLKLDMLATVDLETTDVAPALAVPSDAIQTYQGQRVVFVRSGTGQFDVRPVEVGRIASGQTEITSGLKAGDPVVIRGAFQVKSALLSNGLGERDKG